MEEYYQKVIHLQEKLRQSEEERLKLEMKFNEMLQVMKEEEEAHFKKLRNKYKQFLEEDRRRQQRNDKILEALDRIENRTVMWEAKTEKFKYFRNQYKQSLKNARQSPCETEETLMCPNRNAFSLGSKVVFEGGEKFGSDDDILKRYTQNFSNLLEKRDICPLKNKYSQLGNINSIYWKNGNNIEKIDLEKTNHLSEELDSTQLKTTKDIENSRKQSNKVPTYDSEKYNNLNFKTKYSTESKKYNSDEENTGHATNNSQNLITQSIKPTADQVHDELEQLLKQHKNETSVIKNLPSQKMYDEQLLKTIPLEDQNCPHSQLSDLSTRYDDNSIKSIQNHPVSQKNIVKEDAEEEKNPHIDINVSEPISNHFISPPDAVNSVKSKPPHYQIQRRLSIIAQSDSNEAVLKNQNKYILSQVTKNQENQTKCIPNQLEQNQTDICEIPIKQSNDEQSNEQVSEQQFVADEPCPTTASQEEESHVDEQLVVQHNYDQYSQQHFDDHAQSIQQCYDENEQPAQNNVNGQYYSENGQLLQQYDENNQFISNYDTHEQFDANEKLLLPSSENVESSLHYDVIGQNYDNGQPLQQFYNESNQQLQYYEAGGVQQYEELGQPVLQYDQNEQFTMQYDENGQLYPQYGEHSQPQFDSNTEPLVQYDENGHPIPQYDMNDQFSTHYDENGQHYQEYYDENGQLIPYYSGGDHEQQQCNEISAVVLQDSDVRSYVQHQNLDQLKQPNDEYKNKVMEVHDTDTEGANQNLQISHDSDFNINNN